MKTETKYSVIKNVTKGNWPKHYIYDVQCHGISVGRATKTGVFRFNHVGKGELSFSEVQDAVRALV